ncbi:MAG: hypothetical protein QXS54_00720 [Candidatus Methanomethylicaceae archaeon]
MIADARNQIIIPEPVERSRFSLLKLMRGFGAREVIATAISIVIMFITLLSPLGLGEKVIISATVFAISLGVVRFKYRGYTLEQLFRIYVKYHLSPHIYIHQRAYPVARTVDIPIAAPAAPIEQPKQPEPPPVSPPPPPQPKQPKLQRVPKPNKPKVPKAAKVERSLLSPVNVWALVGLVLAIALIYTAYVMLASYGIF